MKWKELKEFVEKHLTDNDEIWFIDVTSSSSDYLSVGKDKDCGYAISD